MTVYELAKLKRWQCTGCRHQVSVTAQTILHNTKIPLTVRFWAAYLMTADKRGISGASFAAPAWSATLRDSMDDAPQVAAGYDQPGTRVAARRSVSRRDLDWRDPGRIEGESAAEGTESRGCGETWPR